MTYAVLCSGLRDPERGHDCDNNDETRSPGKTEICNGVDDDCDPRTPDGSGEVGCPHGCIDGDPSECYEECNPTLPSDPTCEHGCGKNKKVSENYGKCNEECDPTLDFDPSCEHGGCDATGHCYPECNPRVGVPGEVCCDGNGFFCPPCCGKSACGDGYLYPANNEACDDGNEINDDGCTNTCRLPTCGDGILQQGETCDGDCPLVDSDCDDGDQCTEDYVHGKSPCKRTCINRPYDMTEQVPCDDNNLCTGIPGSPDICHDYVCMGGPKIDCDDGEECTEDDCDPDGGCVHTNRTGPCELQSVCWESGECQLDGTCGPGEIPLACDDGNDCTDDSCDDSLGCIHTPNTNLCDDGNACTIEDACAGEACVGTPITECVDGDGCCPESCDAMLDDDCCYVDNEPCDDKDPCTDGDYCFGGTCQTGEPVTCDDDNACTDDVCIPGVGCDSVNNTRPCEDGNACTEADTCSDGRCVSGSPVDCEDDNVCTDHICDPIEGCRIIYNTDPCADDGNACTNDLCEEGACTHPPRPEGAQCGDNANTVCDFADSCDGSGTCLPNHLPEGQPCTSDNDDCTIDQCLDGKCENTYIGDDDGDGVCNVADNCPNHPNPGLENQDGDSAGDACDVCPTDPNTIVGPCLEPFRVEMQWTGCTEPSCPGIKVDLFIYNDSDAHVSLNEITLRYWYTIDDPPDAQSLVCYHADIGCENIVRLPESAVFHPVVPARVEADYYMELSFVNNVIVYAGQQTGAIKLGFSKQSWTDYDLRNDHSFDENWEQTETRKITIYRDGQLIWGQAPPLQ